MTYLCNECMTKFKSDSEDIKRECPKCKSNGKHHTEFPFGLSDNMKQYKED